MDLGWFAGLAGFALAMAATPGPNNAMVAASGASYGLARTLPLMAGIVIGVATIMLTVAAFGPSVAADAWFGPMLKWVGIAYLLWLAWRIARAEPAPRGAGPEGGAPPSFVQGALLQFVNPKLWMMVGGAVATYGQAAGGAGRTTLALALAAVVGAVTFVSTLAWTAFGAVAARLLASRRAVRAFNLAMAALLVASLIPIVLETP